MGRQLWKKLLFPELLVQALGNPITEMVALGIVEVILGTSMIFPTSKSFFPTDLITQHLTFFMRSGGLISLRFTLAPCTPL